MQASPRVVLPFSILSQCEEARNGVHIVEYNASKKEVWCIHCAEILDWNACLPHLLHDALKQMEDLQYKDE